MTREQRIARSEAARAALTPENALALGRELASLEPTPYWRIPRFNPEWTPEERHRKEVVLLNADQEGLAEGFALIEMHDLLVGALLTNPTREGRELTEMAVRWGTKAFLMEQVPAGTCWLLGVSGEGGSLLLPIRWRDALEDMP